MYEQVRRRAGEDESMPLFAKCLWSWMNSQDEDAAALVTGNAKTKHMDFHFHLDRQV